MRKVLLPLLLLAVSAPLAAATPAPPPLKSFPDAALKDKDAKADVLFVVAGDNRPTGKGAPLPPVLDAIFAEIGLIRPDFVLWTGDTVYGYCDTEAELADEYARFAAKAKPVAGLVPLFNAPGNHEIHPGQTGCKTPPPFCGAEAGDPVPRCSEKAYADRFGSLYGSFDYAGAHFVALDTAVPGDEDAISGDQLAWLKDDLERAKKARAIFLFSHTEFYSSPLIDPPQGRSHPSVARREELEDLFSRYPVLAVFSGHEHLFWHEPPERHNFIDYFVAGGAGAPLYAQPDRGGFSHYLVVRLSGGKATYDVIEPGRLSVQPEAAAAGTAKFWIVNSNFLRQDLPLRGLDLDAPAGLGACADLTLTAQRRTRDDWETRSGFTLDCAASAPGKLHVDVQGMPQGSVLLTLAPKAGGYGSGSTGAAGSSGTKSSSRTE